jgi:hypothetical protein
MPFSTIFLCSSSSLACSSGSSDSSCFRSCPPACSMCPHKLSSDMSSPFGHMLSRWSLLLHHMQSLQICVPLTHYGTWLAIPSIGRQTHACSVLGLDGLRHVCHVSSHVATADCIYTNTARSCACKHESGRPLCLDSPRGRLCLIPWPFSPSRPCASSLPPPRCSLPEFKWFAYPYIGPCVCYFCMKHIFFDMRA